MHTHPFLLVLVVLGGLLRAPSVQAGTVSVGWADIGDPMVEGWLLGGTPAIGYRQPLGQGPWSLAFRGSYSPDTGTNRVSDLAQLVTIVAYNGSGDASFQVPVEVDQLRASAMVDLGPPRDRYRMQGVPHLRMGLFVETTTTYVARYDSSTGGTTLQQASGGGFHVGAIAEFTHELWSARQVGLRLAGALMANVEDKPQYFEDIPSVEKRVQMRPRIGLDLLWGIGGGT